MPVDEIRQLEVNLAKVLSNFDIPTMEFGNPKCIEDATNKIKEKFTNVNPASPPKKRAYQAALKFLREKDLSNADYDFITSAINTEIIEQNKCSVISSSRFNKLLSVYTSKIKKDEMWNLSWYWLLSSYFNITPNEDTELNRNKLRLFLSKTHSNFTSRVKFPLPWMKALKKHPDVLSRNPCEKYAKQVLKGDRKQVNILKKDLSIPNQSWFWHELTFSVVKHATNEKNDTIFKAYISKLIPFIEEYPAFRDKALDLILKRYYKCSDRSRHKVLCDYIIQPSIWGSPKLKDVGLATKWYNVNDNIWRMVRSWVTKENLRVFFQILAARNDADKGRFKFWLQYVDQIEFIKLVFGEETKQLRWRNKEIDKLFKEEEGIYAILSSNDSGLDAFILQIGDYTLVEFSKTGNAAFIYKSSSLPFDIEARRLNDKTSADGLKSAQNNKIIHSPPNGWQYNVKNRLMAECNIYPDEHIV